MTDSQILLEEYARNGSETAFRELVARYFGLVYAAALRLVNGDTHLAEDVAQTVFIDLSRKAGGISRHVMLGGWLHQRTFNVAAPMMRARRRRESREREAAQMNAEQNQSAADLTRITPLLDEAITRLGNQDRAAIILRFFERRDFRAIGAVLGTNEDAARMRVNRALSKLHLLLNRRGVALSAATLGAALASESLTAAPAGLVASMATTALVGSAAGAGISTTLLKIMAATKLKLGIVTAAAVLGAATSLVILQQARARQTEQDQVLRRQSVELAQAAAENQQLAELMTKTSNSAAQLGELLRLRAEAASLRSQTNELALLREQNRRLRVAPDDHPRTPLQTREENIAKVNFAKNALLAFMLYAMKNGDQFPGSFEQATSFLPAEFKAKKTVGPDQFEIVYQGSSKLTNASDIIVLREARPSKNTTGDLIKVYGMGDGSVQSVSMPFTWNSGGRQTRYDTFEAFEKDHILPGPGQ
jgi:RNA polymerase sigma factor (sigma-70 family)